MRNRVARTSAPSLLALLAMLVTLALAGVEDGIVLCFGGDGHVAIEAVGSDGCVEGEDAGDHAASALAVSASTSHCGPCVDVAITSSAATETVKGAKRLPKASAVVFAAAIQPPASHSRVDVARHRSTRFHSEKPHTVVIRC